MMGLGYEIPALALRRPASSGPAAFSPLTLSPSAFFDAANADSFYQDHTESAPVTADSQPIGCWKDLSSNGHDLVQDISAARPTYRNDGSLQWVETDGVDDGLLTSDVFDVQNPITMVLGYQMLSTSGTARVNLAEISKSSTNGMSVGVRPNIDRLQYYSRMSQEGVGSTNVASPSIWGNHNRHVISLQATAGHVVARLDGGVVIDTGQSLTTQMITNQPLRVGLGKVTGSIPGAFRLFGLMVWNSNQQQPNSEQLSMLESWLGQKMGVSL